MKDLSTSDLESHNMILFSYRYKYQYLYIIFGDEIELKKNHYLFLFLLSTGLRHRNSGPRNPRVPQFGTEDLEPNWHPHILLPGSLSELVPIGLSRCRRSGVAVLRSSIHP